jgi:beta-lactam-binding protein with PASTA domain
MAVAGRVIGGALAAVALVPGLAMPGWAEEEAPTIVLTPVDGPVGTNVTASGNDCAVHDGDLVYADQVSLKWDGVEVADATIYGDADDPAYTYEATFVVPDDAYVGGHKVEAVCLETGQSRTAVFEVTAPEPQPVVVPSLVGRRVDEIAAILKQAGLIIGEVGGSGDVIATQEPAAGRPVPPGTAVDVTTTTRPPTTGTKRRPRLVEVPPLRDRTVREASDLLADKGLRLGRVSGRGDLVERQNPAAGAMVRVGSAVNVSLTSRPPQDLVPVPDLTGKRLTKARSIVPVGRLVLANDPGGDGKITGQSPAPGALVPPGSEITIELAVESGSLVDRWPTFVAGVLVLLGAASLLFLRFRRHGRRWVRGHVEVRPHREQPEIRIDLATPRNGKVPTVAISFEARPDAGKVVVRGVRR